MSTDESTSSGSPDVSTDQATADVAVGDILINDVIDNLNNGRIRRAVALLTHAKQRRRWDHFVAEGPQVVREAIRFRPDVVHDVLVQVDTDGGRPRPSSPTLAAVVAECAGTAIHVHGVSAAVMRHLGEDAQGIAAVADMTPLMARADEVVVGSARTVAAFWQVRDPGNAGTVIREADAAGCVAAVFVDDCVDMFNPKVVRSTTGSLFHIPLLTLATDQLFTWARSAGLTVIAADVHGTPGRPARMLPNLLGDREAVARAKIVLFGNEARGLPDEVLERADQIVAVPVYGRAESMNLAGSAAVMLHCLAMRADAAFPQSVMSSHVGKM